MPKKKPRKLSAPKRAAVKGVVAGPTTRRPPKPPKKKKGY